MRKFSILLFILHSIVIIDNAVAQVPHLLKAGVSCSSGIPNESIKEKNGTPLQSVVEDTSFDHCVTLIKKAESLNESQQYQAAYDAYKAYIESCAYLSNSWTTISDVGGMNTKRSGDFARYAEYREWLKKVLYYNLDTNYYCADVSQMFGTFLWFNDQRGDDERGAMAVLYFLVQTNRCPKATAYYDTVTIPGGWRDLYVKWSDSVRNPTLTPFVSTLPSLEDLGLGILRGKPADVKKFIDAARGEILTNIIALENPFSSETKIDFTCREAVAIRFEVFDLLGKKVYDGGNRVYDEGLDQIVLPGNGLPHGELFARFSASDGTVKTIKLQHY